FPAPRSPALYTLSLHDALPILADLRSATEGADVLALPYGDVDVAALVHQDMPSDVARARAAGAATLAGVLPSVSTVDDLAWPAEDRKSTRLNSSHLGISYAVFC